MSGGSPAPPPSAPRPKLSILFEDAAVVAIDKPAGLPSVESPGERGRTCVSELRVSHPGAQPVHRLDRDVSGVMLFALDPDARAELEAQFRARSTEKTYLAVVNGTPRPPRGTIRRPIQDLGKSARVARGGEAAVTHYMWKERLGPASLLEVTIETGRHNQIRIHLAAIGCPLVGERKYARGRDSALRFRRPALHAQRLAFDHPRTRRRIVIEAPLPADLQRLLEELRRR